MRLLLTVLSFIFLHSCFSQTSYVYKRNAFGVLEVFQSQSGLPTGNALYKIKKNVWGYLEVENLEASKNTYTQRPDYSTYVTQGYKLPTKQIFETLEKLNRKIEYDYVNSNAYQSNNKQNTQNANFKKFTQELENEWENKDKMASSLLGFYNNNVSFPPTFKDGWYEVVEIYKQDGVPQMNLKDGLDFKYGISKVVNNKVVEYYRNCSSYDLREGYVFQKIKLDLISPVKDCKSTYRTVEGRYNSIYFLDNILDNSLQIAEPKFSFYSIYTTNTFKNSVLSIGIVRNSNITNQDLEQGGFASYSITALKENLTTVGTDCSNSLLTIAFRKPESITDKFSLGILRMSDFKRWVVNGIAYTPSDCQSTVLGD